MKTLYLIRHAKSSWDDPTLLDKERPLKKRGKNDAKIIGAWMKNKGIKPNYIVSSPAKRAQSTAKRIAMELNFDKLNIQLDERLYFHGTGKILDTIRSVPVKTKVLCLFGHNPDITLLANQFEGEPILNVPTCGLLKVEFDVNSWKEINVQNGIRKMFEFPKKYR